MKHAIKSSFAVMSTMLVLSGCTASDMQTLVNSGEAMPTSSTKYTPISPNHVKLYYSNRHVPQHYQVIGQVSANNDNMLGVPHSLQTVYDELKKQAASLGANGVINIHADISQTLGEAILSH